MSEQHTRPRYTTFKVETTLRDKLREAKQELGFTTYQGLLNHLCLVSTKEKTLPVMSSSIFEDTKPVIITGSSGSGKTTFVKKLLRSYRGPVLILDVSGEYEDFVKIDLGSFFSNNWNLTHERKIRFIPNSSIEISKAEAATIFQHLNFIKNSGELKPWTFVIEEAHRFNSDLNLRTLVLEARKFTHKLLVISVDWEAYRDVAPIFHVDFKH